jgi:RNA polymerase sigma factor (sigma-70 family)
METSSSHHGSVKEPNVPFESLRHDHKAWTKEVYEYLYGPALNQAKRTLGNWASKHAEDVAIKSITKLIRKLPEETEFRNYLGLRNFVVHIARDESIDLIRKENAIKRKRTDEETWEDEAPLDHPFEYDDRPPDPPTPYDYAVVSDRAKIVHDALEALKPQRKAILYDFFLRGLKHREIAERHGLAVGSVGDCLQKGLLEMKKCLGMKPSLPGELKTLTRISYLVLILFWI